MAGSFSSLAMGGRDTRKWRPTTGEGSSASAAVVCSDPLTSHLRSINKPFLPTSIHVGAAVALENLDTIQKQLKVGGRLIAPVAYGMFDQRLMMVRKKAIRIGEQGGATTKVMHCQPICAPSFLQIDRLSKDEYRETALMGVQYVPLTAAEEQWSG